MVVLDTSLVGPLAIPDERDSVDLASLLQLFEDGVVVPSHWRLEVANMMRTAVRRGRLAIEARRDVLERLAALPIEVDLQTGERAWDATIALSDRHGLTPYDPAYIELARRLGATLATRDNALARAADDEALAVIDLRS